MQNPKRFLIDPEECYRLRQSGFGIKQLAERYGCTKGAVSRSLSRHGVRRRKARILKPCACGCGKDTLSRKYFSTECYFRAVCKRPYVSWRQGQRIARSKVSKCFDLKKSHIVHHVDGDNRNNELANLWVFKSHADHMSHHRGGLAQPIWKGGA